MSLPDLEIIINCPHIIGGGIVKGNPNPMLLSDEDNLHNRKQITAMFRGFIERNPTKRGDILKEFGNIASF